MASRSTWSVGTLASLSSAHWRLTAVGLDANSSVEACTRSTPFWIAIASPYPAAIAIAGAPRTIISEIACAISLWV